MYYRKIHSMKTLTKTMPCLTVPASEAHDDEDLVKEAHIFPRFSAIETTVTYPRVICYIAIENGDL